MVLDHNQQIAVASLITSNATLTLLWGLGVGRWVMRATAEVSPEAPKPCSQSLSEHLPPSSSTTECSSRGRALIPKQFFILNPPRFTVKSGTRRWNRGKAHYYRTWLITHGIPKSLTGQGNRGWEKVKPGREKRRSGLQIKTLGLETMSSLPWIPQQIGGQVAVPLQQPKK